MTIIQIFLISSDDKMLLVASYHHRHHFWLLLTLSWAPQFSCLWHALNVHSELISSVETATKTSIKQLYTHISQPHTWIYSWVSSILWSFSAKRSLYFALLSLLLLLAGQAVFSLYWVCLRRRACTAFNFMSCLLAAKGGSVFPGSGWCEKEPLKSRLESFLLEEIGIRDGRRGSLTVGWVETAG